MRKAYTQGVVSMAVAGLGYAQNYLRNSGEQQGGCGAAAS